MIAKNADMKLVKSELFNKYDISDSDYKNSGLKWPDLKKIFYHHHSRVDTLESAAVGVMTMAKAFRDTHAIKWRVKNPEHLVEKIIRKCAAERKPFISIDNYREKITDLVGVRIIHLFEDQWLNIHNEIEKNWDVEGSPVAYNRVGDSAESKKLYEENGCDTKVHKYGYRSVHYLVGSSPGKEKILVEIQVRTIYEEAWAETDHVIRYPLLVNDSQLSKYMGMTSVISGMADELSTIARLQKRARDRHREKSNGQDVEMERIWAEFERRRGDLKDKYFSLLKFLNPELDI
ncbi:MAG: RelA/SpoT domain-containing protein [Planctomycetota bacterium]